MGVLSSLNRERKRFTSSLHEMINDGADSIIGVLRDAGGDIKNLTANVTGIYGAGTIAVSSIREMFQDAGTDIYEAQKDVSNFVIDDTKFAIKKSGDIAGKVLSGKLSEAGDEITEGFGEHQRMMTDNLIDLGLSENNWLVQNSDTVAAAIAAWYLAPEIGAGGIEGGASAEELAQAQQLADTIGSGMVTGTDVGSYGLGELTAEETGAYLASQSDTWIDTAKEWVGDAKKVKNIYNAFNPPEMPQGPPQSIGTGRNANYNNMLDRLKTEIDPYQELTNPAGARY